MQGATYFITYRKAGEALEMDAPIRRLVLEHLLAGSGRFYELDAAVVMPDHVHLLLRLMPGQSLSQTMKGIKGVSARLVNEARGMSARVWQTESFDRIMRDQAEFDETLNFMHQNPVKRGLVEHADEWDGWYWRGAAVNR